MRRERLEGGTPRALRFPLRLPVRYRLRGELEWHRGTAINISRSGLLFQGEQTPPLFSKLEMRLLLWTPAEILCRVSTVRKAEVAGTFPAIAAMINRYSFKRLAPKASSK